MTDVPRLLDAEADVEWEIESEEGSLWTGTRLLIGVLTMAWAGVAFSYFYLRAQDAPSVWRPHHLTPPYLLGTLIVVAVVAGAILFTYGAFKLRQGLAFEWTVAGILSVGAGAVAVGLQVWQLTRLGFYPGEAGYTSVFVGFALLNVGFLLGGSFWPETLVARSLRLRSRMLPEEYFGLSVQPEVRLLRASVRGCIFFWWYTAVVTVFFWVLFYVIGR